MIAFDEILEYETSRLSLIQSIWYGWFTKSFVRKCKKRYDYYVKMMSNKYITNVSQLLNSKTTNQ